MSGERKKKAGKKAKRTAPIYEAERQALIDCALAMRANNLIKGSGGNVSMRVPGA